MTEPHSGYAPGLTFRIMVHGAFLCAKCGGPVIGMGIAPAQMSVDTGGLVVSPKCVSCDPSPTCKKCWRAERDAEESEHKKRMAQRRWARKSKEQTHDRHPLAG